jgi:hypothetical protein
MMKPRKIGFQDSNWRGQSNTEKEPQRSAQAHHEYLAA